MNEISKEQVDEEKKAYPYANWMRGHREHIRLVHSRLTGKKS